MSAIKPITRADLPLSLIGVSILHMAVPATGQLTLARVRFKTGFRRCKGWRESLANVAGVTIVSMWSDPAQECSFPFKRMSIANLGLAKRGTDASFADTRRNLIELKKIAQANDIRAYCALVGADYDTTMATTDLLAAKVLSGLTGENFMPTKH